MSTARIPKTTARHIPPRPARVPRVADGTGSLHSAQNTNNSFSASVMEVGTVEVGAGEVGAASSVKPRSLYPHGIDWGKSLWVAAIHVGALAAPFFFSWHGVLMAVVLHWVTGGLGICLGFHRLFTHGSFQTIRPIRYMLAWIGGLAGEGPVIDWVATHRAHHAHSDKEGDPHSPRDGAWWSHVFWIASGRDASIDFTGKWAPDLQKEPALRWISKHFLTSHVAFGLSVLGLGTWLGGWQYGLSLTAWGVFARLFFVWHSTWLVNSASHMWGYRNYETTDDSRNNWLVALVTYGEGWHNNHHAYPRMANHGHRWWEVDPTYNAIRLMNRLGLAWDVVDYKRKSDTKPDA